VHLAHELLLARIERPQERRLGAVPLVERQPLEVDPVRDGAVVEFQGDRGLGPVDHGVWDPCRTAPGAIARPALGQEQLAVEQGVEVGGGVAQVGGDDAVVLLADGPAVLPLHARRLNPLLGIAGLVDQPDAVRAGVFAGDDVVQPLPECVLVPLVAGEELLEGARRDASGQGHGLDALLGEVGQLTADVDGEVLACVAPGEAVREARQVVVEPWLEGSNLIHVHAETSGRRRLATEGLPNSPSSVKVTPCAVVLAGCNPCQFVVDNIRKTIQLYKAGEPYPMPDVFEIRFRYALRAKWKAKFPHAAT
jgi:hypothetical protein